MTDKVTKFDKMSNISTKPVPMKLFAAWEVDRTPPNCIPRLCSLTITRLSLLLPLPLDLTSLSLAVKMQSSKRTLRSHEIPVTQSLINASINNSVAGGGIGGNSQINSPPLLETELDLHFSLQYPHFIKRDGNRLLILLQRKKKYKTRTILGYKTLAEGIIKMDAVLQKSMDMTVELNSIGKSTRQGLTIATLRATQVSSIPVDQDNKNNNNNSLNDRVNDYSDEDEDPDFSSGEENEDGLSGYAAKRGYAGKRGNYRKIDRGENEEEGQLGPNPVDSDSEFEIGKDKGSRTKMSRRNFKQKIIALLKRFKVPDEMEGVDRPGRGGNEQDFESLFHELDSLSCGEGDDSGQDMDSLSIGSTPKPSLRPFFTSSTSMMQENSRKGYNDNIVKVLVEKRDSLATDKKISPIANNNQERINDWKGDSSGNEGGTGPPDLEGLNSDPQYTGSPPKEKDSITDRRSRLFRTSSNTPSNKKKQSLSFTTEPKTLLDTCLSPTNVEPRKVLLEQLARTFATDESVLPEVVTIVGPPEHHICTFVPRLATILSLTLRPTFSPNNTAEVKAIIQALMNKIQKYCNTTAKPPATVKVILVGGDWLQGAVLRHYVELLGIRPPDWVNHIRFYIVPIGSSSISRHLSSLDSTYLSMFGTENWQQLCERATILEPVQSKIEITEISTRIQRYLLSGGPCTQVPIAEAMVNYKEEDSCQIFVPFICDVRLGCPDGPQLSLDLDESNSQFSNINSLSSSPPQSGRISPPNLLPTTPSQSQESFELQIDYWPLVRPMDSKDKSQTKGNDQGKNSIKSTFRNLQVWRLPLYPQQGDVSNSLTLGFATKEKKQKIMRLGKKKEKDREMEKEQFVEGVARLICSPKQSHPVPMRVYIDGTEWTGVKFFQLSSQWQTHVKNFPIGLIGAPLVTSET